MMKNYKIPLIICMLFLTILSVNAQSNPQEPLKLITYNKNVEAPLTQKEKTLLKEVYAEKLQDYVLSIPNRLKSIKNILRNRVEFIEIKGKDISEIKLLSQVSLFNNYNKDLARDAVFNKASFNPLKYQFNFYSRHGEYVRVDNTNWIIKIKSQHQN